MNDSILNGRQDELVAIVAELAHQYAGGDSTSITWERAQMLMDGALYCLNEYEKFLDGRCPMQTAGSGLTCLEAYRIGHQLVMDKARELREIYNRLMPDFDDFGMECLRDTAVNGIGEFLRRYDARFFPQETLLTLDYPILMDISERSGVDAVLQYMRCIEYEQQILGQFDREYIRSILQRYHQDYRHLFENICQIVMMNILGHIALQKPLAVKGFAEYELQELCRIFTEQTEAETEKYITDYIQNLIGKYYNGNHQLQNYLQGNIHAITVRIRYTASVGSPERVFLL